MIKSESNNKGITLVALVVTIIVLLILAGVSISLVLGDNGIITRAQDAVTKYKEAEEEEQWQMNNFMTDFNEAVEMARNFQEEGYSVGINAREVLVADVENLKLFHYDYSGNKLSEEDIREFPESYCYLTEDSLGINKESCKQYYETGIGYKMEETSAPLVLPCRKYYGYSSERNGASNNPTWTSWGNSRCGDLDIDCDVLIIPPGVEKLGMWLFGRTTIGTICLPASINEIGRGCFIYSSFYSLVLPSGLQKLGNHSFLDSSIERLSIPEKLELLGVDSFLGSHLKNELPDVSNNVYYEIEDGVLYRYDNVYR